MIPTANWYCAKCSRFVDNSSAKCDICGRIRGSSRHQAPLDGPSLYWIRVEQGKASDRSKPSSRKPVPPR